MAIRNVLKLRDGKTSNRLMSACRSFKYSELEVQLAAPHQLQPKPEVEDLIFGKTFSDHIFKVKFCPGSGWEIPRIQPMQDLVLHPACKALHYALQLFEGMKAYRGVDGKIRLFRPDLNMKRMISSAERCALPIFDPYEMCRILCRHIQIDQEWVPHSEEASLYVRPCLIGVDPFLGMGAAESALLFTILSPVGKYFKGEPAVTVLAEPNYVRAWPGGVGDKKMGSNYAPTVYPQREVNDKGIHQILWLFGEDHQITEAGTMNIFIVIKNRDGQKELITPPLNGLILPGVTRASILDVANEHKRVIVTERCINMSELTCLLRKGRCLEVFGSGTACSVAPINKIHYKGEIYDVPTLEQEDSEHAFVYKVLSGIQYGHIKHPWGVCIDDEV